MVDGYDGFRIHGKNSAEVQKHDQKRCTELGLSYDHINKKAKIVQPWDYVPVYETSVYNPWLALGCKLNEAGWRYE